MHIRRVLAAIDLNDHSEEIVTYAQMLAAAFGADLHMLHVVPDAARECWAGDAVGLDLPALTEAWVRDASLRIQGVVRDVPSTGQNIRPVVRVGQPADEILAYAAEQHADAIVVGSHRHGPLTRALRGSTVDRVVRRAHCPVLTVPVSGSRVAADAAASTHAEEVAS